MFRPHLMQGWSPDFIPKLTEDAPAPADALEFLDTAPQDAENPVVLFALEWCEFCWSVRKLMAEYEIPYRAIDLDSVAYQENNKDGSMQVLFEQNNVVWKKSADQDPYSFLPGWLHTR